MASDEEQQSLNLSNRHSLFITGRTGTDKTFLLQELIRHHLHKHGNHGVGVTVSTGKATQPLGQISSTQTWESRGWGYSVNG